MKVDNFISNLLLRRCTSIFDFRHNIHYILYLTNVNYKVLNKNSLDAITIYLTR